MRVLSLGSFAALYDQEGGFAAELDKVGPTLVVDPKSGDEGFVAMSLKHYRLALASKKAKEDGGQGGDNLGAEGGRGGE